MADNAKVIVRLLASSCSTGGVNLLVGRYIGWCEERISMNEERINFQTLLPLNSQVEAEILGNECEMGFDDLCRVKWFSQSARAVYKCVRFEE